ncbi:pilin [Candidatus Parcubacteria bacterium]|nr:pilin [Candidatus Parcubacteria bacterium]
MGGDEIPDLDGGDEIPDPDGGDGIPNLTPEYEDICDLINAVLLIVAEIGAIIGVLFIIWSGFLFIKAQGNPEGIKKAKSAFYTTIIGMAILLGASVITAFIFNTVSSITTAAGSVSICKPK